MYTSNMFNQPQPVVPVATTHTKPKDTRNPDSKWLVPGFHNVEAATWRTSSGTNIGTLYAGIYRLSDDGQKRYKTFQVDSPELVGAALGIATIWEQASEDESFPEAKRKHFAKLADGVTRAVIDAIDPTLGQHAQQAVTQPASIVPNGQVAAFVSRS